MGRKRKIDDPCSNTPLKICHENGNRLAREKQDVLFLERIVEWKMIHQPPGRVNNFEQYHT